MTGYGRAGAIPTGAGRRSTALAVNQNQAAPYLTEMRTVVSPADTNFLLNPEHAGFRQIRIAPPVDYEFDPHLLNR